MQQGDGERRKQISQHETCNVWVLDPQAKLMSSHCKDIKLSTGSIHVRGYGFLSHVEHVYKDTMNDEHFLIIFPNK